MAWPKGGRFNWVPCHCHNRESLSSTVEPSVFNGQQDSATPAAPGIFLWNRKQTDGCQERVFPEVKPRNQQNGQSTGREGAPANERERSGRREGEEEERGGV